MSPNLSEKERLVKIENAVFGDGNGDIGMKVKLDEMYDIFKGSSFVWKFFAGLMGFLVGLAAIAGVIFEAVKVWKTGQF